ncbi:MAG: hypothetical protein FWG15_02415 [Propionibacteriaceae bacterium]|jgi:hypothetical protein|nr:hypothetical protein [Propionibacteriaceae bacterium]
MQGRVNLPGAEELFRSTAPTQPPPTPPQASRASGRVRHEEKITVYISSDELINLEAARLTLRKAGINADRGKIVRAAVAAALADLDARGEQATIVARLGD